MGIDINTVRVGETLITSSLPFTEKILSSGVRVLAVAPEGLTVRRIHSTYLKDENIETWKIRPDQLISSNWIKLPDGYQIPLF